MTSHISARFALLRELELSLLPEEIEKGPNLQLDLKPQSGLSLAAALRCLRSSPLGGDPTVRLDRTRLTQVGHPSASNSTVEAGASAPIEQVEKALQHAGLTLGPLCPSVSRGTVAEWVEGPHAGLRTIPGCRLEPATLSVEVALRSGHLYRSRAAPRSAAGPDLDHLILAGRGRVGLLASATLRAFPMPGYRESFAGRASDPVQLVRLLRAALAHDALPASVDLWRVGGHLRFLARHEGFRYRVARDVQSLRRASALEGASEDPPPPACDPGQLEHEVDWEALAPALELALEGGAQLHRLARESVVLCAHRPLAGDGISSLQDRTAPPGWLEAVSTASVGVEVA